MNPAPNRTLCFLACAATATALVFSPGRCWSAEQAVLPWDYALTAIQNFVAGPLTHFVIVVSGICTVLDPECEYVPEFYRPERGDVILNPLDLRCPCWSPWWELMPGSEAMDAEAPARAEW